MTTEQILEETSQWPAGKVAELVGCLLLSLDDADQEVEDAWKEEVRRRLKDIESGRVKSVPGVDVSARIRQIVGR